MEGERADLTPALFNCTFDANEIAFAKMVKDLGAHRGIASHTKHPSNARRIAVTGQHR
jgi:hypothetical protein